MKSANPSNHTRRLRARRAFVGCVAFTFALILFLALHALTARADTVTMTVTAGAQPYAVTVNPVTNKIYVANNGSANVTVIDGATNVTTTVSAGTNPYAVAVNPVTNKIYVANSGSANVTVIDGATNVTSTVNAGTNPYAVAVNPVTNKIYVANSWSANVTVIDGATNVTSTVNAGTNPDAVAVNSVTNKIYVANEGSANVTVIDGATNVTRTVNAGSDPFAVAVNPVTNKIYVTNYSSANVTAITEQAVNPIPLSVSISQLPRRTSFGSTPSFTFTPNSSYYPYSPDPQAVYYQVDTWQNKWLTASPVGDGVNWVGTTPTLYQGVHIIYAWASDGSEATSINRPQRLSPSSPIIGQISAYLFVVDPNLLYLPLILR